MWYSVTYESNPVNATQVHTLIYFMNSAWHGKDVAWHQQKKLEQQCCCSSHTFVMKCWKWLSHLFFKTFWVTREIAIISLTRQCLITTKYKGNSTGFIKLSRIQVLIQNAANHPWVKHFQKKECKTSVWMLKTEFLQQTFFIPYSQKNSVIDSRNSELYCQAKLMLKSELG